VEQINAIELNDEARYPDSDVLMGVLGDSYDSYAALLEIFRENGMSSEWRYYIDGKAWLCKVQRKGTTIVWMSAWKGYMKATIYFPQKFEALIGELELEDSIKDTISAAKRVGRSIPCMFEIRDARVLKDFVTVMRLKLAVAK